MLVQTLKCLDRPIQLDLVKRLVKGVFEVYPPRPRYSRTWDVSKVLKYLRTLVPAETISLKCLTLKLVSLLALVSAQRVQTLKALSVSGMCTSADQTEITFLIDKSLKTTSQRHPPCSVKICKFPERGICVVHTLLVYLKRTSAKRKHDQLLLSFKTLRPVSTETISRWLCEVLRLSDIDIDVFRAHSFRGASTSAAARKGVSVKDIMKTADWSSARTFSMFYCRPLSPTGQNYAQVVLQ